VAESGVIIDYMIAHFGQSTELAPKFDDEEFDVRYHLHHTEVSLQPDLLMPLCPAK
jgi:hypothetical protein